MCVEIPVDVEEDVSLSKILKLLSTSGSTCKIFNNEAEESALPFGWIVIHNQHNNYAYNEEFGGV